MAAPTDYDAQIQAWRAEVENTLKSDTGWLTVAGLYWLKEGANRAGSAPGNDLVLPAGAPAHLGVFTMKNRQVMFAPAPGAAVTLRGKTPDARHVLVNDHEAKEDILVSGTFSLFVIDRGEKTGIRLRDLQSKYRREFTRRRWYPVSAAHRVEARFESQPERTVRIPNVVGTYDEYKANGILVFQLNGREHRLEPVISGGKLFLIFKDKTAAKTTYGAGRFLYAELPRNGRTILDFNQAYNPPCAFTPYATCPLPPKNNQLAVAIEAGELNYGDH